MTEKEIPDYYEFLEISPQATQSDFVVCLLVVWPLKWVTIAG
jgi:hypothetical protein